MVEFSYAILEGEDFMNNGKKLFKNIYPLIFVLYPLLVLKTANLRFVRLADTLRTMMFALLGFGIVWLFLWFVTKSILRANGFVSLFAILFFSYGHVYLMGLKFFGENFSHKYVLITFSLVAVLFTILINRHFGQITQIQNFLSITGLILLGISLLQIAWYELKLQENLGNSQFNLPQAGASTENSPDVYLIILDAHARSDILLQDYGLDNSDFIDSLERLGFYVADCSQSNYPKTELALQSMFNMDYAHKFIEEGAVLPRLKNSLVKQIFNSQGYQSIAFQNYFSSHLDFDPDILMKRNAPLTDRLNLFKGLSEYESLVVETSALRLMIDFRYLLNDYFGNTFSDSGKYYDHYLDTLFILEALKELPESSGQKFVFAHIAVPHWPYVFSAEGEYDHIWKISAKEGYSKNVRFIDQQILSVVKEIISKSPEPPVIILMGDHGPTGKVVTIEGRLTNLYALYADEEMINQMYEAITPVNTFRLVFNQIFSLEYELLEDISFDIWNNDSYELDQVIPNTCVP